MTSPKLLHPSGSKRKTARMNQVCVLGLWHLGLVSAAGFSDLGCHVIAYDRRKKLMQDLERGKLPLYEPGLEVLIKKYHANSRLRFAKDYPEALENARTVLIAYDTPVDEEDRVDVGLIDKTIFEITPLLQPDSLIVLNSQVPVGSSERWQERINTRRPEAQIDLVYSPENLRLGQAIEIFKSPEMMIVGSNSERAREKAEKFFALFSAEKFYVSWRTAEMAKHAMNAFLATSISFANELGNLCEVLGVDGFAIAQILKRDSRIGKKAQVLPGLGFSGATLARDLRALQSLGKKSALATPLFDSVLEVNQRQVQHVGEILAHYYGGELKGKTIAIFGLTYKPGTSTLRRSASLEIIQWLQSQGARIRAHDPQANLSELSGPPSFEFFQDPHEAGRGSHGIVLVTEWPEYRELDYSQIRKTMSHPMILDTKNFLEGEKLKEQGFVYLAIGRGPLRGGKG